MEKDTSIFFKSPRSLISDDYYFKYIFKKTERILSAVLYVLSNGTGRIKDNTVVSDLESFCVRAMSFAARTLSFDESHAPLATRKMGYLLVRLESKLSMLQAVGLLSDEYRAIFTAEIDALHRSLRSFAEESSKGREERAQAPRQARKTRTEVVKEAAGEAVTDRVVTSVEEVPKVGRRERIIAVLNAQPGASIKDISDTITDCSEKTIQRELSQLIRDGRVVREGERRWSRYSLV